MHIITQAYYLIGIAILISFVNHHTIKLQPTISVMLASVLTSLGLLLMNQFGGYTLSDPIISHLKTIDFNAILMNGLLSFLLFAGSLSISIEFLKKAKLEIATLSLFSTISSTFIISIIMYYGLNTLMIYFTPHGLTHINLAPCLLFGALISPTDPIAVIATLKQIKAPKKIETILAGESLFNDGVGIVTFLTIYTALFTSHDTTFSNVISLFIKQSIGGICFGLTIGILCARLIKTIKNNNTLPTLLTISIVTGGYALCQWLNISGPLAMVASGIFITYRCPHESYELIHLFWDFIDELLNIILFFLVGFEIIFIQWNDYFFMAMFLAIIVTLLTRIMTVCVPLYFIKKIKPHPDNISKILVWGGLRGGLAIALALSVPRSYVYKDIIVAMTYAVVLFSILIQGTSISSLIKYWQNKTRLNNIEKQPS